jgi:hypothetical protein
VGDSQPTTKCFMWIAHGTEVSTSMWRLRPVWMGRVFNRDTISRGFAFKGCRLMLPCSTSGLWGGPREVPEGESDLWAIAERLPLQQVGSLVADKIPNAAAGRHQR